MTTREGPTMHSMNDYARLDDRAARVGLLVNRGEMARAARELASELPTVAAALALRGFPTEASPGWESFVVNCARSARGGSPRENLEAELELKGRAVLATKDLREGNTEVLAALSRMPALEAAALAVLIAETSPLPQRETFARWVSAVAIDDLAREQADAEQRKMSDPPLDGSARMSRLAESFRSLYDRPGVRPWKPEDLDTWATTSDECTWTACAAAQFVLSVYQERAWKCGQFDLQTSLQRWDAEHRAAFALWASSPWWP